MPAHVIREPSKTFAKSVCALQADRKWAVTGTPIQNRLLDLFSLFKFLGASPFDNLNVFNSEFTAKWKARSDQTSVAKLKTLVNCLSLRRPKETIDLPARRDKIRRVEFSDDEWYQYQKLRDGTRHQLDSAQGSRVGTTFLNALKWINQLRLLCNHGTSGQVLKTTQQQLPTHDSWSDALAQTFFNEFDQAGQAACSNPFCKQDLSSVLTDEEHCDEPFISEMSELFCSPCVALKGQAASRLWKVCNHIPRRSTEPALAYMSHNPVEGGLSSVADGHSLMASNCIPSKIKRVVQDLEETPDNIKRSVTNPKLDDIPI